MRCLIVFLLAQITLAAPPLEERIDAILRASKAATRTFWGIRIVSLSSGETVYQSGQDQFFVPASNAKLFSTALALMRLGPDYRFQTVVAADASPDASGRIDGDLRLIGGGDPTLSAREIPYRQGPIRGDPLRAIEELAGQVAGAGVRRIDGDVVGDDSAYIWEPYPAGWGMDDGLWEYGAPVSALSINDNSLSLSVRPGTRAGDPARISLWPQFEYYLIDNRVLTAEDSGGKIEIEREPGSRAVLIWGKIPRGGGRSFRLAINDPALYAASALADALIRRGIAISGKAVARHRYADEAAMEKQSSYVAPLPRVELARRISPPLGEILEIIDKESQNLQAELILREVARARGNIGSLEAGLKELKIFLAEAGIDETEYNLEDGSGLSRLNLVTPTAVTRLLRYMHSSEYQAEWMELLPIAGTDGTLRWRFADVPGARRIRAKTGTMRHVSALSGYAETAAGETLAFSILANHYNGPPQEIRRVIDKICEVMIQ